MTAGLAAADQAVRRHAAIVIDVNTGKVLHASAADEQRYPASLTKMMTLYLLFQQLEQKKLRFNTPIVFSEAATLVQPSKIGIEAGASITVKEAAQALIVKSANDVALAVAEHISGSQAQFAQLMTTTARQLGMTSTTFRNPHGLPDDGQVTTARDMARLGIRLQDDFPQYYRLFSARDVTIGGATYRTHNSLLVNYEGTDGIKTGYIAKSGFNLVANVKRGDKHVLGVVFGGKTAAERNRTMTSLLTAALAKASPIKSRQPARIARAEPAARQGTVRVAGSAPVSALRPVAAPVLAAAAQPAIDVQVARVRSVPVAPQALEPSPGVRSAAAAVRTAMAPSYNGAQRLNGPETPRGANAALSGVHLQVGAYASKADAEKQLALVRQTGGPQIAALAAEARAALSNGKTVFRARFIGVDPVQAGMLCNDLRRRQIDCLVAKPE